MTLSINLRQLLTCTLTETVGAAAVTAAVTLTETETLADADAVFTAETTLSGGTVSLDLVGSLANPINAAVTFETLMMLYLENDSDYPLVLGGSNQVPILTGTTPKLFIAAGASVLLTDPTGVAVTADTGDLITVASGVAAWSAGTYADDSVVLHSGTLYKSNKSTANEPPHADWDALGDQAYKVILIGQAPAA